MTRNAEPKQALHHPVTHPSTGAVTGTAQGALGGLAGGVAFGAMMHMGGMLPMVAMLVGSESVAVGWVVHLVISAVLGAVFGIAATRLRSFGAVVGAGVAYGALWWVLGSLLIMPARMGMPLLAINAGTLQGLAGHLLFGAILGVVVAVLRRRRA